MPSVDVLGVPVRSWVQSELVDQAVRWARDRTPTKRTILYANVHVLNTAYTDTGLLKALRSASTVYCDGSGVRLGAWLLGRRLPARMTGADWIDPLCHQASLASLSLFLVGGPEGVAARAADTLIGRYPGLRIVGTHHGYGSEAADADLVASINRSAAGIVLVGMGTPRQERWIARWRAELDPPIVWAVGALFDFVAGLERRGPRWMLNMHLEWLARLAANPRERWRRCVLGNPRFVARVLGQRFLGLPSRLSGANSEAAPR
jgi:N-acetylglucosaminyldiphosphoundecaprenol N-acetyl-beta-D-mannosaminyltransferase